MKYLSSRSDFLQKSKFNKINENVAGAGPFANDIAWGDSLLGRLLHHFARKAKIGIDLKRMDSVIKRLKTQFDYLVDSSKINGAEIDEETKKQIDLLRISILLGTLINVIKEGKNDKNHLDEVIRSTKETIYSITEMTLQTPESEPDRQELLEKLDEFYKEIESMVKEDEPQKEESEGEDEETETTDDENKTETGLTTIPDTEKGLSQTGGESGEEVESNEKGSILDEYHLYIANLKSIYNIIEAYKSAKRNVLPEGDSKSKPKTAEEKSEDDIISKKNIELENLIKKKTDEWIENQKKIGGNTKPGEGTRARIRREAEEELKNSKVTESVDEKTTNILKATKSLYNYIMSDPSNLEELKSLIGRYEKISKNGEWREGTKVLKDGTIVLPQAKRFELYGSSIKKIYDFIKNKSISESLKDLLSKTESLAIKIKDLYNVSKLGVSEIPNESLRKSLIVFNETLKKILDKPETIKSTIKESKVLRYQGFRKILEAESQNTVQGEEVKSDTKEDASNYDVTIPWNKIFSEEYLKKWIVTDELKDGINRKLENLKGEKYVINGIDPILEIVKIFNRAYKLHTSQTIPTARSGGKVSNKKFREYEYIGKGSGPQPNDEGSGFKVGIGPYRNIRLFDKWENAVLDIIKDSKYQVLFNEDTVIQVGSADPRFNVSKKSRNRIEGGGKVLLKFINDMLNGDDLYRTSDGGGAQQKFISKYFRVDVENKDLGYTPNEVEDNGENANITPEQIICEFKGVNEVGTKVGNIFSINNGDYYMIIVMVTEENVYVKYSKSFKNFSQYLKAENVKGMRGDLRDLNTSNSIMYLARIPRKEYFKDETLERGSKVKMKSIDLSEVKKDGISRSNVKEVELNISDLYSLVTIKGESEDHEIGKPYILPTSAKLPKIEGDTEVTPNRFKYSEFKAKLNK